MTPKRRVVPRGIVWAVLAAAIGCLGVNAAASLRYGSASFGDPKRSSLTDVAGLSHGHLLSRLAAFQRIPRSGVTVSDASAPTIGKLEQSYSSPVPILFFSEVLSKYDDRSPSAGPLGNLTFGSASYRSHLRALIHAHSAIYGLGTFPDRSGAAYDRFTLDARLPRAMHDPARAWFLTSPNSTLFNTYGTEKSYDVSLERLGAVHNRLVMVPSLRASAGIFDRPARPQPGLMIARSEPDPLIHGGQIDAVGRYLLFDVINPSPSIRVVIDFTATLNADGASVIPPISMVGIGRYRFPVAGRGSARLVSPPVVPRVVDGIPMIEFDMGANGKPFRERRKGLLALFGTQYPLDPRRLVGFVRDISVISEADYRHSVAPRAITRFPADLRNPKLEYSGFYEDGWVSESAVAWLTAPHEGRPSFVVRGSLPDVPGLPDSVVHVKIDGVEAVSQPILPGAFEVRAAAKADGRRHAIALTFDRAFRLPNGDDRLSGALLSFVGYE